jgi:hypothetical protein
MRQYSFDFLFGISKDLIRLSYQSKRRVLPGCCNKFILPLFAFISGVQYEVSVVSSFGFSYYVLTSLVNLLKPSRYFTYHQVSH